MKARILLVLAMMIGFTAASLADPPAGCPPPSTCFNCMLPGYSCFHYAKCSEFSGRCECPAGFGGDDCSQPGKLFLSFCVIYFLVCNSLAEGDKRKIREGDRCECTPGWTGINCNGISFIYVNIIIILS